MEVCYTILRQQADEVQAPDRVFALRGGEHGTMWTVDIRGWPSEKGQERVPVICVKGLQLGEVSVKGGHVVTSDTAVCADLEDVTWWTS